MSDIRDNLSRVKSVTWTEVFDIWRKNEAGLQRWQDHYKARGYNSWDDWRKHTIKDLHAESLAWSLFEIIEPQVVIPSFHGGPFRSWIEKYYGGNKFMKFSEIVLNEELQESVVINEMIDNFSDETYLAGILVDGKVVIIEGMHRCCAVAIATARGVQIKSRVLIALAEFAGEIPVMGQSNSPT